MAARPAGTAEGQLEWNLWQLRADFRYAVGSMDYHGSGEIHNIDDRVYEGRALFARAFPFGDAAGDRVTPYAGYGYRRLEDDLGGLVSTTGARGYDRISQYHYVPIGIEAVFVRPGGWKFKPTFEFDYLIKGNQESKLSQAVAGLNDISNYQGTGYGLRMSLMVAIPLGAAEIEAGPFARYWYIDRSDLAPVQFNGVTVGGGYEPANETVEAGLAVKVRF